MEGIVRGIIKLNPLTEIIFLISVSIIVRFSMNKPPAMLVVGILALASSKKPPVINY